MKLKVLDVVALVVVQLAVALERLKGTHTLSNNTFSNNPPSNNQHSFGF